MTDVVTVQDDGTVVVVHETAIEIVEVVAAGPQGGQGVPGIKGDKGDDGDVTPAATAAKLAAESAATAAAASQTAAAGSASTASTAATTATTKAAEASTSATNASGSAATATGAATTATTKAGEANTSATNAAASALTATTKASQASTSEANALASQTAAASSATTATTKAGEAATSATNASTAASTATAQAGIASTKASEASTSASNAAASAATAGTAVTTATTKAAEASTSATSAATSATSATASKNAAASSEASALSSKNDAATSATTASTKASEAAVSATTANTGATTATTQAGIATTKAAEAVTSATNAAGSATAASGSASTASTQATNAAASATAAQTSATNAAASEASVAADAATATAQAGIATTKASEAAASASTASTGATTATTKASEASASASSALAAKVAAETVRDQTLAAFDSFDDRYLGPKAMDPTVDNDGNALVGGSLYFNTNPVESGGGMKVFDGSVWRSAYASLSGALIASNNLSDLASASAARINLGLGNVENKNVNAIFAEMGYNTIIDALGFVPYNVTNPDSYITSAALSSYLTSATAAGTYQTALVSGTSIKTVNGQSVLGSGNIQIDGGVTSFNTRTGAVTLGSGDVTGALGFTPYNATNPTGFITSSALTPYLTSATAASTYQPIGSYLTGITSGQVTTALGFTPYNATNPSGYITSSALSPYLLLAGGTMTGNLAIANGTDSRVNLQVSGVTEGILTASSTNVRLSSANAIPMTFGTNGVTRLTLTGTGYITTGASEYVGIGAQANTNNALRIARNLENGTSAYAVLNDGTFQSGVTTQGAGFRSVVRTAAATFTMASMHHYQAVQATLGAGSAITTQAGFVADASMVGATSNYGFQGSIAAATGRWNAYMEGTAQNWFAGNVGIGSGKSVPATALDVNGTVTATQFTGSAAGLTGLKTVNGNNILGSGDIVIAAGASLLGVTDSVSPYNTFLGSTAGQGNTTGTYNIAVGQAGWNADTGSYNVQIGTNVSAYSASSRTVAIGASFKIAGDDSVVVGNVNTSTTYLGYFVGNNNTIMGGNLFSGSDQDSFQIQNSVVLGNKAGGAWSGYVEPYVTPNLNNVIVIGYEAKPSSSTASNEITLGNASVNRFRVPGAGIDNTSAALSGTTPSVDVSARDTYTLTTSGNTTFTFANAPSSGQVGSFSLIVTAGGTHTLTWPASVDWKGGTIPSAPAGGETDIYAFMTINGGTTWYGFLAGEAMA